ncbi:MAG TPA: xylulokinase [Ignavibacteria bacterium]
MKYLLGIDIGTSGTKSLLIDEKGKVIASYLYEYPLYTPHPNWAEQNPEDWWKGTVVSIQNILKISKVPPDSIAAIGLSGQMHSSVFLDKDAKVLRRAILWCDTRTKYECEWIMNKVGRKKIANLVANPALEGFTAPKIIWLRNNEPKLYDKVDKVLLPKDYIRFRLTGEMCTEVSDAAGTLLLDVKNRIWSKKMMDLIGVPYSFLPPVYESIDICGNITEKISKLTGLKAGTPVVGGGADNTCGAVGTGVVKAGRVLASLGTSGVIFAHTNQVKIDPEMRVHTFCHSVPEKWYLMGVMLSAGGSFRWFRDAFCELEKNEALKQNIDVYEILTQKASKVKAGSEGLFFLPYLMGERTPHQSADAKGAFVGISARHNKEHFIRAVIEGITFGMKDSLEIVKEQGIKIEQIRLTGGGAKSKFWRKLQANIYNSEVVTVNNTEGPAFGAAIMAGVGGYVFGSIEEATEKIIKVKERVEPEKSEAKKYKAFYDEFKSLYPALKKNFENISLLLKK